MLNMSHDNTINNFFTSITEWLKQWLLTEHLNLCIDSARKKISIGFIVAALYIYSVPIRRPENTVLGSPEDPYIWFLVLIHDLTCATVGPRSDGLRPWTAPVDELTRGVVVWCGAAAVPQTCGGIHGKSYCMSSKCDGYNWYIQLLLYIQKCMSHPHLRHVTLMWICSKYYYWKSMIIFWFEQLFHL